MWPHGASECATECSVHYELGTPTLHEEAHQTVVFLVVDDAQVVAGIIVVDMPQNERTRFRDKGNVVAHLPDDYARVFHL